VLIRGCTFSDNIFACIGVGSETSGGIRGVHIEHCTFKLAKTYVIYIKSRPGRGAFVEDISGDDLDVQTATNGFLRINLLNSGLQDADPVLGDEGIPTAKNYRFHQCASELWDAGECDGNLPVKPLNGLSLVNITGTCTKGITLANITGAELSGIQVTGLQRAAARNQQRHRLWTGRCRCDLAHDGGPAGRAGDRIEHRRKSQWRHADS